MAPLTETEKVRHLLRRFGLGASEAEVDYYGEGGHAKAIDRLLDFSRGSGFDYTAEQFSDNNVNIRVAQIHWMARLLITETPVQEKLTLFLHDHFAVSAQKVTAMPVMIQHVGKLRAGCQGSFHDLLVEMSTDPAMIYWLDNQLNEKGKPNENYAREIMELFTLGVGHYSEKDVQEVARAFTGYGYAVGRRRQTTQQPRRGMRFYVDPAFHDDTPKTILGKTGPYNGHDVCKILADHPRTALYLTTKMWEFFAYENPEPALIDRLAKKFQASGLNLGVLARAIMEAPEFYSEKAVRKLYKNPIDFVVASMRGLGLGQNLKAGLARDATNRTILAPAAVAVNSAAAMGLALYLPPDVAGWNWGKDWISSGTMVERIKWADRLFAGPIGRGTSAIVASTLPAGAKPEAIADSLVSLFDAGHLPQSKLDQLRTAAVTVAKGRPGQAAAFDTCSQVARLLFGTPEFQFS